MKDTFGENPYILNIDRCIGDMRAPAVIRMMFFDLKHAGYLNVGKLFKEMSDSDLGVLIALAEATHPEVESSEMEVINAMKNLTLMSLGLLVGEGIELTEANCERGLRITICYISLESLYRKGLIHVHRENWTMNDSSDAPVASRID